MRKAPSQRAHTPGLECVRATHADSRKVLEALGHFKAANVQVAPVDKVAAPQRRCMERLTLRHLVVMVGKLQIDSARVKVQAFAKVVSERTYTRSPLHVHPHAGGQRRRF